MFLIITNEMNLVEGDVSNSELSFRKSTFLSFFFALPFNLCATLSSASNWELISFCCRIVGCRWCCAVEAGEGVKAVEGVEGVDGVEAAAAAIFFSSVVLLFSDEFANLKL